jgi:hypothetical protein
MSSRPGAEPTFFSATPVRTRDPLPCASSARFLASCTPPPRSHINVTAAPAEADEVSQQDLVLTDTWFLCPEAVNGQLRVAAGRPTVPVHSCIAWQHEVASAAGELAPQRAQRLVQIPVVSDRPTRTKIDSGTDFT